MNEPGFKPLTKIDPCFTARVIDICVGYHMSGEVISVLSLEGRYYNCHERA